MYNCVAVDVKKPMEFLSKLQSVLHHSDTATGTSGAAAKENSSRDEELATCSVQNVHIRYFSNLVVVALGLVDVRVHKGTAELEIRLSLDVIHSCHLYSACSSIFHRLHAMLQLIYPADFKGNLISSQEAKKTHL